MQFKRIRKWIQNVMVNSIIVNHEKRVEGLITEYSIIAYEFAKAKNLIEYCLKECFVACKENQEDTKEPIKVLKQFKDFFQLCINKLHEFNQKNMENNHHVANTTNPKHFLVDFNELDNKLKQQNESEDIIIYFEVFNSNDSSISRTLKCKETGKTIYDKERYIIEALRKFHDYLFSKAQKIHIEIEQLRDEQKNAKCALAIAFDVILDYLYALDKVFIEENSLQNKKEQEIVLNALQSFNSELDQYFDDLFSKSRNAIERKQTILHYYDEFYKSINSYRSKFMISFRNQSKNVLELQNFTNDLHNLKPLLESYILTLNHFVKNVNINFSCQKRIYISSSSEFNVHFISFVY
ncbi:hypothetical protein EDEG_01290 [Edhazardia aedis USNM 41457]|uniref:Uncharacterized protein n=1 Tax=Edhazardia aedis (strain USNM 41457) TaxID=1003232 RepID=J9D9P1_EDHAE|nr:hypothetical protein EDEG_01290 [Edhazardia aedis USNM 41457]|eukprot:EJW04486.1 hypothetical protein EDEG_01290 [Edhazardia aedis USNM 41457]